MYRSIWNNILRLIIHTPELQTTRKHEKANCLMCGKESMYFLAPVMYWELQKSSLVKCSFCEHVQLDPFLEHEIMKQGCLARYLENRSTDKKQARNNLRNLRRGIWFAAYLKRAGFTPKKILEWGPGTGDFSAGVNEIFPQAEVTVADVLPEVLEEIKSNHHFETIQGTPETPFKDRSFDLIITRDLLEHVHRIDLVLKNLEKILRPEGFLHFTVPVGRTDLWKYYQTWKQQSLPAEMTINHQHYFNGSSLEKTLNGLGLKTHTFYAYKVRSTLRGLGWRETLSLCANPAGQSSSRKIIQKAQNPESSLKVSCIRPFWLSSFWKFFAPLICTLKQSPKGRLSPEMNLGHEFFGLFKK